MVSETMKNETELIETEKPEMGAASPSGRWSRFALSWGSLIGVFACGLIFLKMSGPLRDNSLFTHIATGRFIVENGYVPSGDIYTYTAEGAPWVVQSWGVSTLYALLEGAFGPVGIRALAGAVGVALFALLWVFSRPLNLLPRTALIGALTISGMLFFGPRPTIFGFLFLVVTLLAARGDIPAFTLTPVAFAWVNMHGSWPTGFALLVVLAAAALLDRVSPRVTVRATAFFVVGVAVAALGPLGLDGVTFPYSMLQRQDVLGYIVEWQRPSPFSLATIFLWFLLLLAVAGWFRNRSWRSAALIVFSVLLGFSAFRNIPVASLILFFPIVDGWRGVGRDIGRRRSPAATAVGWVAAAVFMVDGVAGQHNWDYSAYPVAATDQMEAWGWMENPEVRVAGALVAGNYWSLRYGPDHKILHDDRFDMYDRALIERFMLFNDEDRTPAERRAAIESFNPDVVVWNEEKDYLLEALAESDDWREIRRYDDGWLILCRVSSTSTPCSSL